MRIRRAGLFAIVLACVVACPSIAPAAPPAPAKPSPPAAKPRPAAAPKPAPAAPLVPLAILPSIARVRVTSHGKAIEIVEEVNLPRGDWKGEALRFHVAFGSPGPRAIDAHLVEVGDGELEPEDDEAGEVLSTERVARRPPSAHPLLGRESMAGIVVQIPAASLTKALVRGNMASLRIRSLVDVTEDVSEGESVVVRLGASRGTPLTVGRITATAVTPASPIANVEAKLCGPDADANPLAVGLIPHPPERRHTTAIAPVLAVRHPTDDLCVRLWHTDAKAPREQNEH